MQNVEHANGPVVLITAEAKLVLIDLSSGQRLTEVKPRLERGGKYEMENLELRQGVTITPTVVRRLVRDAREGRKRFPFLVRQGWAKTRAEPSVVAHQRAAGARPVTKAEALARLAELAAGPST